MDIDTQAVEVTKLSLLLKVLEGESQETIIKQYELFHQRALPDLGSNIKCGNSLIGPDFYQQQELNLLDDESRYRVNAFDWQAEFPEIMKSGGPVHRSLGEGGFDAVIGNPPYVFGGNYGITRIDKDYFKQRYSSGLGKVNLFTLFIEMSIRLLRRCGLVSFIIPNTFLRVTSYAKSRELVLKQTAVRNIVDLGTGVFEGATTSSIIIVLEKHEKPMSNETKIQLGIELPSTTICQREFLGKGNVFDIRTSGHERKIISMLKKNSVELGSLCDELIFGVVITQNQDEVVSRGKITGYKPFVEGRDISRYFIHPVNKYLNYNPKLLHRPRTSKVFEAKEKLLIQRITGGKSPLKAAYDENRLYNKESINNLILKKDVGYNIKYVCGLLNSTLMNWFYRTRFTNESTLTVNLSKEYLSQLPIPKIYFSNKADVEKHDRLVALVDRMLDLHKKLATAKTPHDKESLQRQISPTDREIDQMVYDLYGLTEEEIKIVERAK